MAWNEGEESRPGTVMIGEAVKEMLPAVSIVIAARSLDTRARESLEHCLSLDYPDYEIIVLTDREEKTPDPHVTVIPTGPCSPSEKRRLAAARARGEVLAFLDSDAYPSREWLRRAAAHFRNSEVAAVGGPAVTPPGDGMREKASGAVYSSVLGGGTQRLRYRPERGREVEDFPSCNLLVRRSVLERLEGLENPFWPGEDTLLCLAITKLPGAKILYDPEVLVYHHRRKLFLPHLRQVASYARHRGYFAKRYGGSSLRLAYFLPSILTLAILLGWIPGIVSPVMRFAYVGGLALYALAIVISGAVSGRRLAPLVAAGLTLTHATYGLWFLRGLVSRRLREEVPGGKP